MKKNVPNYMLVQIISLLKCKGKIGVNCKLIALFICLINRLMTKKY